MRTNWRWLTAAALTLLPAAAWAAEPPGVKVGEKAPAFRLADQSGKERTLDDLLKNGNVALVFYRSANW